MEFKTEEDLNTLDDLIDLFNEIPGFKDCNYDDAVNWLTTDANDLRYQILNRDEIISSLQNEESDDSSSDEIIHTPKGPTTTEAFSAFETGLEWFEKQAECCPTQLLLLKRLRDLAAEKRVVAHRQIKIDNLVKQI
ncbi:jerky protein-like [Aphis craccivora]|uniref:Jerky protein-like n=1 Tax=Aphis craccivora TaxID=307492 RepID=A0A6G0VMC7_APHCR|nr:jerky protein-like [Aphis craccivora]